MTGKYLKRKIKKYSKLICETIKNIPHEIRRFFVKFTIKNKDFTVISNNCWGGRVYKYLKIPYRTPTAGLYFFAEDYLKFISDLHHYLSLPLEFISPEKSRYYEEIKKRNDLERPIAVLGDIEVVFRHYSTAQEAEEKWNRRKARVNYENMIFKFSKMYSCTDKHLEIFDSLPFNNKFILTNKQPLKYNCEIFLKDKTKSDELLNDTIPFPRNVSLKKVLNNPPEKYPDNGFNI